MDVYENIIFSTALIIEMKRDENWYFGRIKIPAS